MIHSRKSIIVGSTLMIILAIARFIGGLVLIIEGTNLELDQRMIASSNEAKMVGIGLILVSIILVRSAIGMLKSNYFYWKIGLFAIILFILDGLINGFILFGQPLEKGTIINITASVIIVLAMLIGRKSFIFEKYSPQKRLNKLN